MEDNAVDPAVSEKDVELVADIFKTITKTVKTFNVYPKDNPIYKKFAADLFDKFSIFFESNEELPIDIDQFSLLYKGKEVFHSEDRLENIALLLFADGLRQLIFNKGITHDEITDFIDVMRMAPRSDMNDDDDIVTLLWEKNIKNMGYSAVEDNVDEDRLVEESLLHDGMEQAESPGNSGDGKIEVQPVLPSSFESVIEPIKEDELVRIKEELSGIDENSLLSSAVDFLFEIIADKDNSEFLPETVQGIGKIMDIRMKKNDVFGAIEILEGLRKISADGHAAKQSEAVKEVIDRAGSLENIRILFDSSLKNDQIRQYLLLLKEGSMPNMIEILGELQDRKQRRFLCEMLAELGSGDVDVFGEALEDERWYLLRNLTMILGITRNPLAVKHIAKVLKYPDIRVRREAVRALDNIRSDETKKHLLSAMKDEDFSIRISAIKSIRRFKAPDLFEEFQKYVSREDIKNRSFDEKRELLETYALLGGEKAFPLLSELFRKKGILEKDETTEIRTAAAYGLGLLGSPQALSLIETETGSRKQLLRDACMKFSRKTQ